MNFFVLFSLPEEYLIDDILLRQRYETLQRLTHPDKYANNSAQEKRMYMQKNAQVNDGYHVLSSPVERGLHLLALREVDLPSEQETIGDNAFLMEQMELREALAEAETETDFVSVERQLSAMQADYTDSAALLLAENVDEKNIQAAVVLNKLRFVLKLAQEVKRQKQYKLNSKG
ncbi:MAG: Fe-S protein assembly co-chaperone HscB [Glaciecola sp.]